MAAYVGTAQDSFAVRNHEDLLLPKMLELCHPDDSHHWLLELRLTGGAASQGGHLPEANVGASRASRGGCVYPVKFSVREIKFQLNLFVSFSYYNQNPD